MAGGSMKILAVDTSTRRLSVAVTEGKNLLAARYFRPRRDLALSMVSDLKRVLEMAGFSLKDMDLYVTGLGPGSFTGLRVGLSGVKGLSLATEKPVFGVSSLDAIAMNICMSCNDLHICVLTDARRGLVYTALYHRTLDGLVRKGDYGLQPVSVILSGLSGRVVFTGDGLTLFREQIVQASESGAFIPVFAPKRYWYPRAEALAALAHERLSRGQEASCAQELVPLYLYPQDCQVGREKPKEAQANA